MSISGSFREFLADFRDFTLGFSEGFRYVREGLGGISGNYRIFGGFKRHHGRFRGFREVLGASQGDRTGFQGLLDVFSRFQMHYRGLQRHFRGRRCATF